MRDADFTANDLRNSAIDAANGVCSLCEEYLSDRPACPDLPYHVDCLDASLR